MYEAKEGTKRATSWSVCSSSASPTCPHFKLPLVTGVRRNKTVQLGQQSLGTKWGGKDGLVPTGMDRMKGDNDYFKLDLPAVTQLVN